MKNKFNVKPFIFCHIPKCAGMSVGQHFHNWFPDSKHVSDPIKWNEFVESGFNADAAQGHIKGRQLIEAVYKPLDFSAFAFIRNPIDRLISEYRYGCSPGAAWFRSFIKKYPNFESFAFNEYEPRAKPNFLTRWLICDFALEWGSGQVIQWLDWNYDFIGTVESFDASMRELAGLLGVTYEILPPRNVTISGHFNEFEVSEETMKRLKELHKLDWGVWERINERFSK